MPEQGVAGAAGYRAFISYSHRDDAVAKTLHRRLETYRLPKKLIGAPGERGPIPARLTPIFRDLDELSAADDLSVEIKAALARSEVLIILCSPAAKASKWVNLEIETFRALHGTSRPVLAALIEGEPADAFPAALTAAGHEPVAADFRKGRDGKRLALLKLVAGIAGAPLDALVQRDAQRQNRRVMAITGGALAAALTMALLLVVALRSQAEAQRQRAEAEGLVEYMLTDLRERLKGVGRLDVMTAVNERAMQYYGGDTIRGQLLKAQTLHALGEDDEKRRKIAIASRHFREAYGITRSAIIINPNNTDILLAHGQSQFWLGYLAKRENKQQLALKYWSQYKNTAYNLNKIEGNSKRSLMELAYSNGNLCDIYYKKSLDLNKSLGYCRISLKYSTLIQNKYPEDAEANKAVANRHGWIANVLTRLNEHQLALEHRRRERSIIDQMLSGDSANADLLTRRIWSDIGTLRSLSHTGQAMRANLIAGNVAIDIQKLSKLSPEDKSLTELQEKLNSLNLK